jgi:hypothetical protein
MDKRIEFAKSHTWENNAKTMYASIIKATKHLIKWD